MSNQEILTKAIERAIGNGWDAHRGRWDRLYVNDDSWSGLEVGPFELSDWGTVGNNPKACHRNLYEVLFNDHDFAKALWGEEPLPGELLTVGGEAPPAWKYHLTMLVISEDPIKYLGENI